MWFLGDVLLTIMSTKRRPISVLVCQSIWSLRLAGGHALDRSAMPIPSWGGRQALRFSLPGCLVVASVSTGAATSWVLPWWEMSIVITSVHTLLLKKWAHWEAAPVFSLVLAGVCWHGVFKAVKWCVRVCIKDAKWNKVVLNWVTASHDSCLSPSAIFLLLLLLRPFKSLGFFNLFYFSQLQESSPVTACPPDSFAFKAAFLAQAVLCVLLLHESALWLSSGGLALTHISF